jgi:cytoskeleton protein RodZ
LALASLAIVLAAGGLSYYWWQQGRGIPRTSAPAPAEEAWTAPGTRTPTPAPEAPGQTPAPTEPPAPPGDLAAEESPAEPSLARTTPELPEAAGETAAGGAAPAAPPGAEDSGTPPGADASPDDAPGAPPEAETAAAPAASEREVVMAFSGPCWVDIRDSEGEFKLFGEMGKGDRRVLGGTPPYSVILGNAAAVSVTVGGEPYDLEGIARGNVARFTLDPAGQP